MRRVFALPAALLGIAGSVALAPMLSTAQAGSTEAPTTTIEGTYRLVAAEPRPGVKAKHDRPVVVDARGRATDVVLSGTTPVRPGSRVRISGRHEKSVLRASKVGVVSAARQPKPDQTAPTAPTTPTGAPSPMTTAALATAAAHRQRVLVVLASWTSPDSVTQESARSSFFDTQDTWFTQASHGAMGLTGDVTPWLTIAGPDGGRCWANMEQTMNQAKAAALAAGYDAATYERTVLYFPKAPPGSDCGSYAGWAFQPGDVMWLNGTMDPGVAVHEQGHNLGLGHAFAWGCMLDNGLPATLTSRCNVLEYGDPSDVMGSTASAAFYSASRASALGWLPATRVADLSAGGTAALSPYEGVSGLAALKITAGGRTYWAERRSGAGLNAGTPLGSRDGVQLRMSDGTRHEAGLLDLSPDDRTFDTSVLAPGGSWSSPDGVTIKVGTDVGAGLPVTVLRASAPAAPGSLALKVRGSTLTATWSAPSNGGAPLTAYLVALNGVPVTLLPSATTWSASLLAPGTYIVTVQALNVVGTGAATTSFLVKR